MAIKLLLFISCGALWCQDNHYHIHLTIDKTLTEASGRQTVTCMNPNATTLSSLYFRIHDSEDETCLSLRRISDSEGRELSFSP